MSYYHIAFVLGSGVISLLASSHAALFKRDSRALVGWVAVIWLVPISGALLYLLFGINRIQRRAHALQHDDTPTFLPLHSDGSDGQPSFFDDSDSAHLASLAELVDRVGPYQLLGGNAVSILQNGDETYPRMIQDIDSAEHSIALCTYIFDGDRSGQLLLHALRCAVERGVAVRLLIDDVGARYSWPSVIRRARREGIPVSTFLPVLLPRLSAYANLRNHRKLLVVDGCIGFAGGINIREEHCLEQTTDHAIQDLHFRITGPVVAHLQDTFAKDWYFAAGERLSGNDWFPEIPSSGGVVARGIADGPDEDFDILRNVILGAIASARQSIAIVTPYFLPDGPIIASLNVAAMRGIDVRIVVPENTNHMLVQWASTAQLSQILERGCRLWRSSAPFDHSKLMIVDGQWSFFGSANWDPRSLRLNFEFNVECYDKPLAQSLLAIVDAKIEASRECTREDVDRRSLPVRLRDGFARVLTPYL